MKIKEDVKGKINSWKAIDLESEIQIQSALNNSNETYTFMCLAEPAVSGSAITVLKFRYEI